MCRGASHSRGPACTLVALSGGDAGLSSSLLLLANLYLAETYVWGFSGSRKSFQRVQ